MIKIWGRRKTNAPASNQPPLKSPTTFVDITTLRHFDFTLSQNVQLSFDACAKQLSPQWKCVEFRNYKWSKKLAASSRVVMRGPKATHPLEVTIQPDRDTQDQKAAKNLIQSTPTRPLSLSSNAPCALSNSQVQRVAEHGMFPSLCPNYCPL